VFKYDVNQDGIVDAGDGDKVYLFFGTGRGGKAYYSLDVTNREAPKFRWVKTNANLPDLATAWSPPTIARVNIGGSSQSEQKFVLIFGGGYNIGQDAGFDTDSTGNAIYMLDLETGSTLWSASDTTGNLQLAEMTHSIPAAITVMDTDGDRFADRMYASDVGGRVWRFDIWNGNSVDTLVTGGVLASLGGAADPSPANIRRLYNAPDAAPITLRGSRPFINIAIGSGYRGHPLDVDVSDRFYSIRDYMPFSKRTNASYTADSMILDSELIDITDDMSVIVGDGSPGWKLRLDRTGEKVLADSVTASGVIFFPTFTPLDPDPAQPCLANPSNRVYAVHAASGRPFTRWDDRRTGALDEGDRFYDLGQTGIAPSVSILANPSDPNNMGICQVGAQILNRCVKFGTTVRSYWEHR
jgi:type IV pilus assembly protein PilY1